MAVPAPYVPPEERARLASEFPPDIIPDRDVVREAAARLYGRGYDRKQIATILGPHLVHDKNTKFKTKEQRRNRALTKLRTWERQQSFRDMVYANAIVELDMDTPNIIRAVGKRAKRGRTDAARFALELTGRHNPKEKAVAGPVNVIIANVPRPD